MAQAMFTTKQMIKKAPADGRPRATTINDILPMSSASEDRARDRSTSFSNPLQQMTYYIQRKLSRATDDKPEKPA